MTHVKISGKHDLLIGKLREVARKALERNDVNSFDIIWQGITELQCEAVSAKIYSDALHSFVGDRK